MNRGRSFCVVEGDRPHVGLAVCNDLSVVGQVAEHYAQLTYNALFIFTRPLSLKHVIINLAQLKTVHTVPWPHSVSPRHTNCKWGLYAMAMSFRLSVRMFVCLSLEVHLEL